MWARINYGRSNQVIMQSRQQPSGKKLITAPDRRRRWRVGSVEGEGWLERYFGSRQIGPPTVGPGAQFAMIGYFGPFLLP